MNIVFFGTPDFVLPVAQSLLYTENFKLCAVVTNPERPVGRTQTLTPSPVKEWSIDHNIPVLTPENLDENFKLKIKNFKSDLGILAAYGKIIPQELIDVFPKGILVIHPSLLPKYRGASPVQAAILNGDKETGVTIIKMDEKMDHGPIISQFTETLKPEDTTGILTKRLFDKASQVLLTILPAYIEDKITPREQDHGKATYCKLLKREDGKIDWSWKPEKIERFIRAMSPWPGAWTLLRQGFGGQAKRLKILKAHLENCKLVLDEVQLEGKKPVSWEEFEKGYPEAKFTS